ncbi:hypothetical protein NT6N_04210 [Oceaniferula spumae]|uniref:Uncharacterized protein n=1 Tax=Oceaniferula spumae TaxID=2979115 RepID=A0AAT9FHD4_9BACT
MNAIERTSDIDIPDEEITWEGFGIHRTSFRPQWDGDLVNLFTVIHPQESEATTESFVKSCITDLAQWIIQNQNRFSAEDRYQIIVGWPTTIRETGRHIAKAGGTLSELSELVSGEIEPRFLPSWSGGIFSKN